MPSPVEGEFGQEISYSDEQAGGLGQETGSGTERAGFNPYVGPRSFDQEHSGYFFGRDEETRQLTSLVVAHRVVLFYAESGAGKTSLLRASVIPELNRRKKVTVLPIGRVGGDLLPGVDPSRVENLFVFNTLVSLAGAGAEPGVLQGQSLRQGLEPFLKPRGDERRARPALLILDQFEELFTSHPEHYAERAGFFQQLQECLAAYPQLSLLLSMREDYIARLDYYAVQMPDRLRTRFRLERLPVTGALAAVKGPVNRAGRPFEPGVAEALVDNLRRLQIGTAHEGQTAGTALGEYVEPVHLQIVCWQLWENLPVGGSTIRAADVRAFGDVDQALIEFYDATLQKLTDRMGIGQRQVRAWFDKKLITPAGTRGLVYRAQEETEGLPNHAVDILNNAYLIRAVIRGGDTWYEVAHDRLVEPILGSNRTWLETHLSPLQRQAALWEAEGRSTGLLLREQALAEAETWATANEGELTAVEREFLRECQEARAVAERERRQSRRIRWLAIGATIFAIIAILLALVATAARNQAQQQARIASSGQLAAQAQAVLGEYPQRSLLLALEASKVPEPGDPPVPAAEQALRDALSGIGGVPLYGHEGAVLSVAFSPDGRWLASASRDETARLWDIAALLDTGLQAGDPSTHSWVLRGHEGHVTSVAFSPDGRWLATGCGDHAVRLWDLSTVVSSGSAGGDSTAEPWVLHGHEDLVTSVAFSPDGRWLASASWDRTIRLWDVGALLSSGTAPTDLAAEPVVLHGHEDRVLSVAFSPDGHWLASASLDATARLWDLAALLNAEPGSEGAAIQPLVLRGHEAGLSAVAFSPDGQWLATGSEDKTARVWDFEAMLETGMIAEDFAPQPSLVLGGHGDWVTSVVFSPDGRWLATGCDDGIGRLWDLQATDPSATPLEVVGHEGPVPSVAFRPGGSWLATGSGDRLARLWNVSTLSKPGMQTGNLAAEPLELPGHGEDVTAVAFSPDGRWLATTSRDNTARLWDMPALPKSGLQVEAVVPEPLVLRGHEGWIWSAAFSPDGHWLATGSADTTVRLWDVAALPSPGQRVAEPAQATWVLHGHELAVTAVAFSPDGRWLAAGGEDKTIRVWDVSAAPDTAEPLVLRGHEEWVTSVAFSPDGSWLASASWDGTVRLWDSSAWLVAGAQAAGHTPEPLVLHGYENPVMAVAFSPDGQWLAVGVGGWDSTARLWDVSALLNVDRKAENLPEEVWILRGHTAAISSLAFSSDGHRLVTGSLDETARLWDISTLLDKGRKVEDLVPEPVALYGHGDSVKSVAFSPDGQWLASGSADDTARLWHARLDELAVLACQVVGRNLTADEWQQYFRAQEYRLTCENLPAG